jgi:hypothetical protein
MFKFLKKDSMLLGFILGAIIPPVIFIILYFSNKYLSVAFDKDHILEDNTVKLVSIVLNIFVFRYYLVKEKVEKTGRGVLLATFIYALVIFYFIIKKY